MSSTLENLNGGVPLTPLVATDKIYIVRDSDDHQSTVQEILDLAAVEPPAAHTHDERYYTEDEIDALLATVGGGPVPSGLVSGGEVAWESGLTFRVSAAVYYIDGVQYSAAEQTVTLTAADATNDRFDVLALNTAGAFVAVAGTAAALPSEPDIDPSTQLKLKFVLVEATATEPGGVTITNIYQDNAEWTASTSGSGINVDSTSEPKSGTKCVEATNMGNGAYALFDKGAVDVDINSYRLLRLFIKSKATWNNGRTLRLQWFANGVAKGTAVTIASGYWGFNSSITGSYQFAAIPIDQFVVPAGTAIDQLRVTDSGGSIGFRIDEITLESSAASIGGGNNDFLTLAQADARYARKVRPISFFIAAPPTDAEVLLLYTPVTGETVRVPIDLAGTSVVKATGIGVNPTGAWTGTLKRNNVSVGTIDISTGGVVTLTAAAAFDLVGGTDILTCEAPATADATLENWAISIKSEIV